MRGLTHHVLEDYCSAHSDSPSPLLRQLERETHLTAVAPQMLPGPLQGKLLEILSKMIRPQSILEIGTFTGYGAICLAQGLAPGGRMLTIEIDAEQELIIRKYLKLAGLQDTVRLQIGDALQLLPVMREKFDLIYVDAGKRDYPAYYKLAVPLLNTGGVLLFDNVLWGGKVIAMPDEPDALMLAALNTGIRDDPRTECVMLPVRDGLTIVRKI